MLQARPIEAETWMQDDPEGSIFLSEQEVRDQLSLEEITRAFLSLDSDPELIVAALVSSCSPEVCKATLDKWYFALLQGRFIGRAALSVSSEEKYMMDEIEGIHIKVEKGDEKRTAPDDEEIRISSQKRTDLLTQNGALEKTVDKLTAHYMAIRAYRVTPSSLSIS